MKILVICQYYAPEPVRISDICEELVKRGNEVDVIAGVPNYPMGVIYDGYRGGKRRDETLNGVHVRRTFTIGRRSGVFWRFLNYYSFSVSSSRYVSHLKKEYDAVFVNQLSPVMMAKAGLCYQKKHHTKLLLYCLDLWPESLVAGGIRRGSMIYRYYRKISGRIYCDADKILVTSKHFSDYLTKEFAIKAEKIGYLPQYAEEIFCPTDLPENKNTVDFTFAGNIGKAQSVETILTAAREFSDRPEIRFHIIGDGSALDACKKLAAEQKAQNVFFYGRKPVSEMPRYYADSDAMLLTVSKDPLISLTLPGKVQSYMAAGKPIIAAADGAAAEVISEAACGFCGPAQDAHALAENIRAFLKSDRRAFAENSYQYYLDHFQKEHFMDCLSAELAGEPHSDT